MHKKNPPLSIQQQEQVSESGFTQTEANALALCSAQWKKPKTSSTATRHRKYPTSRSHSKLVGYFVIHYEWCDDR